MESLVLTRWKSRQRIERSCATFYTGVTAIALFHLSAVKRSLEEEMEVKSSWTHCHHAAVSFTQRLSCICADSTQVNFSLEREKNRNKFMNTFSWQWIHPENKISDTKSGWSRYPFLATNPSYLLVSLCAWLYNLHRPCNEAIWIQQPQAGRHIG